jgi:calcium-dependent protein kinase
MFGRHKRKQSSKVPDVFCDFEFVPEENIVSDITSVFTIEKTLGSGISSQVCEIVRKSDNKHFAMKALSREDRWSGLLFENESKILRAFSHPGIIRLEDVYVDRKNYYILTEMGTGDLFNRIKTKTRFTEAEAKLLVYKLLTSVKYMHHKNVVHRDLKPENIIFATDDENQTKLIDFGDAVVVKSNHTYTEFVGTPCYLAPERLREHKGWELKKSDTWAIGVMTYEMVTGKRCFYGKNQDQVFDRIRKGYWHWPRGTENTLSAMFKDFVKKLLAVDPLVRVRVAQALRHPWLADVHRGRAQTIETSYSISISSLNCKQCTPIFGRLVSNKSPTRLKELLLIHQLRQMTSKHRRTMVQMFNQLDVNNDGYICAVDLLDVLMRDGLNGKEGASLAAKILEEIDQDEDGRISFDEFQNAHVGYRLCKPKNLKAAFETIDADSIVFFNLNDLS